MRQPLQIFLSSVIVLGMVPYDSGGATTLFPTPRLLSTNQQTDQHYNRALSFFDQQQYELARQEFQQALTDYRQVKNLVRVVRCLLGIGQCDYRLNRYDSAISAYQQAQTELQLLDNPTLAAETQRLLGWALYNSDRPEALVEARAAFQSALVIYQTNSFPEGEAEATWGLALCAYNANEMEIAQVYFSQAESKFNTLKDARKNDCRLYIAKIELTSEQYDEAISDFNLALKGFRDTKEPEKEAQALYYLGKCYLSTEKFDNAIQQFGAANRLFAELKDMIWLGYTTEKIAYCNFKQKNWSETILWYNRAVSYYREAADTANLVICFGNLGDASYNDGNYIAAAQYYLQADSVCHQLRNWVEEAKYHFEAATAYEAMDSMTDAICEYGEAARLFASQNEKEQAAKSYYRLAKCLDRKDQWQEAAAAYLQAAQAYQQKIDRKGEADSRKEAAGSLLQIGKYEEAIREYNRAFQLYQTANDPVGVTTCSKGLADAYFNWRRYREAAVWYQKCSQDAVSLADSTRAKCYLNAGHCFFNLEDYQNSLQQYRQALALFERLRQTLDIAECLNNIADVLVVLNLSDEAIVHYRQSIDHYRKLPNRAGLADACLGLGKSYLQLSPPDTSQALQSFQQAKDNFISIQDNIGIARSIEGIAEVFFKRQQWQNATDQYLAALELYFEVHEQSRAAHCLETIGSTYFNLGNYDTAISNYTRAMDLYASFKDPAGVARCRINLGDSYLKMNDPAKSWSCYDSALSYFLEVKDQQKISECLTGHGDVYFLQSSYAEAKTKYQEALQNCKDGVNPVLKAAILVKSGQASAKLFQSDEALSCVQQAAQIYREWHEPQGEVVSLRVLSDIYLNQGEYQKAITVLRQARQLVDKNSLTDYQGTIRIGLGNIFYEISQMDSARQAFTESLDFSRVSLDTVGIAASLNGLANIQFDEEKYDSARMAYEQALQLLSDITDSLNMGKCLLNLGNIQKEADDLDRAVFYYESARSLYTNSEYTLGIGISWNNLGTVDLERGKFPEALAKFGEAQRLVESVFSRRFLTAIFSNRGVVLEKLNRLEEAYQSYKAAIAIVEEGMKQITEEKLLLSYIKSKADLYDRIISLLYGPLNRPEEAQTYLERSRSEGLVEAYERKLLADGNQERATQVNQLKDKFNQLLQKELDYQAEAAKPATVRDKDKMEILSKLIAQTRGEIYELERLLQQDPDYPGMVSVRLIDLQSLQSPLPSDAAIVWYYPAQSNLFVQILTRDISNVYSVAIGRDSLFNAIKFYRQLMALEIDRALRSQRFPIVSSWQDAEIAPLLSVSKKLYHYLIAPIETILAQKKTVVFIPAGMLYYLPLHALAKEKSDGSPLFVIERWRVAYMTSTTLLNSLIRDVRPLPTLDQCLANTFVFANPDGSLPGSEREAAFIGSITNNRAHVFSGEIATEEQAVRCASQCGLLVLTTHTLANPKRPDSTFVVLNSSPSGYDGYWYTKEIEKLRFPKLDLVVLPNCETAIGEENPGGDVRNLVMAFAGGGAASVIATLWPVSDQATSTMMRQFYTDYFNPIARKTSKILMLQQAQLSLLKDPRFRHPFCWAGFMLFGYWQ